jgi:hypothetical protein
MELLVGRYGPYDAWRTNDAILTDVGFSLD